MRTTSTEYWYTGRIDAMADALAEWREESAGVRGAYQEWSRAAAKDSALGYAAYAAALDREERASSVYAELVRDVAGYAS